MSANAQLLVKAGHFLEGQLSFSDLAGWVQDREEIWAILPANSMLRVLADTVMLAAYELAECTRDESSIEALLSQLSLEPSPAS